MATFDISNNATAAGDVEAALELGATDDNAPVSKLQRALVQVGLTTSGMAAAAAIYRPPSGPELPYFLGLGGAFVAGVAEVCAALWVSRNAPARCGKGKMILYASMFPLVVAVGLGGFAIKLKN